MYNLYVDLYIYIYIYIYSLTGFGTHSSFCLRGGPGIPQQQEEPRPHLCDVQEGGREDSGYIVLDVRNAPEVAATGPLSPHTQTLPLPAIIDGCFRLDEQEFKTAFGFDKPTMDETLVFSCAAGIRATRAAEIALGVGYTKVVVYKGGANEWFA